jgi:hypothetical protein
MSNILISPPPTTLLTGLLQLDGGVAISSTPVYVADQTNTDSKLALSTTSVNVNTLTGSALVNIKGTGASSSTTSLLVQNSAGSVLLQANDNASLGIGTAPDSTAGRVKIGGNTSTSLILTGFYGQSEVTFGVGLIFNNASIQPTIFQGSGTEQMRITQAGNMGLGINAPTSRLHVKGSGSTSATTSLLVQDSSNNNAFYVRDDRFAWFSKDVTVGGSSSASITMGTGGSNNPYINAFGNGLELTTSGSYGANSNIQFIPQANWSVVSTTSGTGVFAINTDGNNERLRVTQAGNVGVRNTTPYKLLSVKSSTSTEAIEVRATTGNTGVRFSIADATVTTDNYSKGAIYYLNTGASSAVGTMIFALNNALTNANVSTADERMRITPSGSLLIGTTTESARLQVLGSGTTSATTNTLKQNSSGTQLFKLTDDGKVTIGNGTTGTALLDVSVGAGSTPPLRLKGYSDAGTSYLISAGTESFQDGFKVKMVNGNVTMGTQLNGYTFGLETFNGVAMHIANAGNIGMGTTSPNVSAKLDVSSTTQGFLPPRMTTAQKLAIGTPANGLMVFDTSLNQMSYYNGVTWINW